MSTVTVSTKRNRVYQRKFDHDEARTLRAEGWTYTRLAERYGVTWAAVRRICDDRVRAQMNAANRRSWASLCPDCGKEATRGRRCVQCAGKLRVTTVRTDTLRCLSCREWKLDDEFAFDRSPRCAYRRARHFQCRLCNTQAKRAWRRRNPGHEAATIREYRRRKKSQAA